MNEITPEYGIAVAEQMSLVGVFLGGISVTILISLVVSSRSGKLVNWIVGFSAWAACTLLISVIASLRLMIALHPDFPGQATTSPDEIELLWKSMVAGYGWGIISLSIGIGLSGWLRSRLTGLMTMAFATLTVLFFFMTSIFS